MVNSGRLSTPSFYRNTPLSTPDEDMFGGVAKPGLPAPDAPLEDAAGKPVWLLDSLDPGFTVLAVTNGARPNVPEGLSLRVVGEDLHDAEGLFAERYDARPGSLYLIRPDQYVCARFRSFDADALAKAHARAKGGDLG